MNASVRTVAITLRSAAALVDVQDLLQKLEEVDLALGQFEEHGFDPKNYTVAGLQITVQGFEVRALLDARRQRILRKLEEYGIKVDLSEPAVEPEVFVRGTDLP